MLLAVVAACGGVSTEEFTQRADAVCARFRDEAGPLLRRGDDLGPRGLRRLQRLMIQSVARLRRLTPPRGDEDRVARYIAGVEINAGRVAQLSRVLERDQARRARRLRRELAAGTEVTRQLADQYGFNVCGA